MLSKPDIQDETLITAVQAEYGLRVTELAFLPLGADVNTAVYRVSSAAGAAFFLKLRKGSFDRLAVDVPVFLAAQGIQAILAPLATRSAGYWASLETYRMLLYPFVEGRDGYERALSDEDWLGFGAVLHDIHSARLPQALKQRLPRETYSTQWRDALRSFQEQVEQQPFAEPAAAKLAAFMKEKRSEITRLLERAGQLGWALQGRAPEFVLCHSDVHPGNLLLADDGRLFLVDWDQPMLAPRERDLVLLGGGSFWNEAAQLELFYRGYGDVPVDRAALAYYRYERIIQDMAAFCEQLLLTDAGGADREQALEWFKSNFLPGHELELARRTDNAWKE